MYSSHVLSRKCFDMAKLEYNFVGHLFRILVYVLYKVEKFLKLHVNRELSNIDCILSNIYSESRNEIMVI